MDFLTLLPLSMFYNPACGLKTRVPSLATHACQQLSNTRLWHLTCNFSSPGFCRQTILTPLWALVLTIALVFSPLLPLLHCSTPLPPIESQYIDHATPLWLHRTPSRLVCPCPPPIPPPLDNTIYSLQTLINIHPLHFDNHCFASCSVHAVSYAGTYSLCLTTSPLRCLLTLQVPQSATTCGSWVLHCIPALHKTPHPTRHCCAHQDRGRHYVPFTRCYSATPVTSRSMAGLTCHRRLDIRDPTSWRHGRLTAAPHPVMLLASLMALCFPSFKSFISSFVTLPVLYVVRKYTATNIGDLMYRLMRSPIGPYVLSFLLI